MLPLVVAIEGVQDDEKARMSANKFRKNCWGVRNSNFLSYVLRFQNTLPSPLFTPNMYPLVHASRMLGDARDPTETGRGTFGLTNNQLQKKIAIE